MTRRETRGASSPRDVHQEASVAHIGRAIFDLHEFTRIRTSRPTEQGPHRLPEYNMSSRPKPPFSVLIKEALAVGGVVALLSFTSGNLEHYHWPTASTATYAWTCIWLAMTLLSLRFLVGTGPSLVAASGCVRNFTMLWNMSKEGCISSDEVVYGGIVALVATGVSFYFIASFWKPAGASVTDDQVDIKAEKA